MPPRNHALPSANTESAREARRAFFCELCNKGYARQNEFDAHESSYDHLHRKRAKELRQLTKDPKATKRLEAERRKANEKAGLISLDNTTLTKKKPAPALETKTSNADFNELDENGKPLDSDDENWTQPRLAQWQRTMELCDAEMRPLDQNDPFFSKKDGWEDERYRPEVVQLSEYNPLTGKRREGLTTVTIPETVKWTDVDDEELMKAGGWKNWYDMYPRHLLRSEGLSTD